MTLLQAIETEHLRLIPFSLALKKAVMEEKAKVTTMIDARVPDDWPGPDMLGAMPFFVQMMEKDAHSARWDGIIVHKADQTVIGDMGFKSGPDENGMVEMGYSIIPMYRRHGYATEMARGLVEWAFQQPGVKTVTAECLLDNIGSIKVLENVGMQRVGVDGDLLKWQVLPFAH